MFYHFAYLIIAEHTYNMLIMYYLCNDLYVVCLIKYALQLGGNKGIYKDRYILYSFRQYYYHHYY